MTGPSMSDRIAMHNANVLKIGMFGANCSSSRTATRVPERWSASWPDCLALAKMADEAGIDFMLPIGRWKGYGGETDFHGTTLETITWAVGLLAATERMTVFGTVHAPLFHPLIAAKDFVTAAKAWAHFDIYAWTPSAKPARPDGGECQIARALYALLRERYGAD